MKRFSRLNQALQYLRRPADVGDPTATAPAAPVGSALAEYEKFTARKKFINITRTADSLQKSLIEVGVQPFGLAAVAANQTITQMSQRVQPFMTTFGLTAALNHQPVATSTRRGGFIPAKAVIKDVGATAAATPKTSQITGIPYKTRGGKSYTFPFGAGAGDEATEFGARAAIAAALQGTRPAASVSFKGEDMKFR